MSFLRTLFLNTPEELAALRSLLAAQGAPMDALPEFQSAQLHGDAGMPQRVQLYRLRRPEHNHQAVAELVRSAGQLSLQPQPRKGTIL